MKKYCTLLLSGVICMLSACTDDASSVLTDTMLRNSEAYISVIDTCTAVDIQKAKDVACLFSAKGRGTRAASMKKEIEDVIPISNENGEPLLYIVNYKNGQGFIVISGTQNYEPVLAFSDTGKFYFNAIEKTGLSVWLDGQKRIISHSQEFSDSIKSVYKALWTDYNMKKEAIAKTRGDAIVPDIVIRSIRQWESEGYTVHRFSNYKNTAEYDNLSTGVKDHIRIAMLTGRPYNGDAEFNTFILRKSISKTTRIDPLLKTTWGQKQGFNQYTPNNYPAGCVAVAMGQIMKYHEYPTHFSWIQMANSTATDATASFLAEIGRNVGMDYNADGSESNIEKALTGFKSKYGYNYAIKKDHEFSDVLRELEKNRPVYMRGYDSSGFLGFDKKGHAWVCDGYSYYYAGSQLKVIVGEVGYDGINPVKMTELYTYDSMNSAASLFHMNWGWHGSNDGFYSDYDGVRVITNDGVLNFSHGRKNIINLYSPQ